MNEAELDLIRQSEQAKKLSETERLTVADLETKAAETNPLRSPKSTIGVDERFETGEASENPLVIFSSVSMWSLCVTSFFRAAGYAFFVTWFFWFLEEVYKIDKSEVGFLASLPLLAVVIGSLSGGVIVDALLRITTSKRVSRGGTGFVALSICAVLTLASAWTSTAAQLSAVMALGGFFSGLANPASWAVTIDLGGKHTAIVMGTMNMAGCIAGIILPVTLGTWFDVIIESGGDWNQVIYLHAAFYFAAAAGWLFINPNRTVFEESAIDHL